MHVPQISVFISVVTISNRQTSEYAQDMSHSHMDQRTIFYYLSHHSGKSATVRKSNHGSVYVRSIMRSTLYQKAPFCSPEMAQSKLVL